MAVVQISRIQLRRGKAKAGTGIPQLASGEMAWAVDTQQLYIGNGSVAEGAPAVGNTKILTENDLNGRGNILDLIQYIYREGDESFQTGESSANYVERPLQSRLDDRVIFTDFVQPTNWRKDGYDYTEDLQRAIVQLFLNPVSESYNQTDAGAASRVVLELPAGNFKITNTIYIPSYANIVGAGQDKTVIEYTGSAAAFQFVNDLSTIELPSNIVTPAAIGTSELTNQPRYVNLSNLTVQLTTSTTTALQLDCVRDSKFENIKITGSWAGIFASESKGIALNSLSTVVTCERNTFKNIQITGFQTAVFAPGDIARNVFDNIFINNVNDAYIFGSVFFNNTETLIPNVSTLYGPCNNVVTNSIFGDITDGVKRYAMFVGKGTSNSISESRFINVGHNGQRAENPPVYPQVYFAEIGNVLKNTSSDRTKSSLNPQTLSRYVPEAAGTVEYSSFGTLAVPLEAPENDVVTTAFRLPLSTTQTGVPQGRNFFTISYIFKSDNGDNFVRQGTLYVTADADNGLTQLVDEYNFAGTDNVHELKLDFYAVLVDDANVDYTNPLTQSVGSLAIKYNNIPFSGQLYYSYTSSTYNSDLSV